MKIRFTIFFTLAILVISCRSSRSLNKGSGPVYFTTSNEFFKDTNNPILSLSYPIAKDLSGGFIERAEIRPSENTKVSISQPTLFRFMSNSFLAYPNEQIVIKGSVEEPVFITTNGNKRRDNELIFFNAFNKFQKYPTSPLYIMNGTLDTILQLEKQQRLRILTADSTAKKLFDSLALAFNVSEDFRKLAKAYTDNQFDGSLLWIYNLYRDTLKAHGLYFTKLKELVPGFNAIDNSTDFNYNVRFNLDDVVRNMFPNNRMWNMENEVGFKRCFDSVAQNFTGLARDYLLSRVMYRANNLGLSLPAAYKRLYRRYNSNASYKKIVQNTKRVRRQSKKDKSVLTNQMLTAADNKHISLEAMLSQHKGKLVFIDLWASWCSPCIKEIPYVNQLVQRYTGEKIVFISISLDKQIVSWREAIEKYAIKKEDNYLLVDANKTAFYKQYSINEIPRFMLVGKDGQMLNANAPAPSEKALTVLLDSFILEK